MGRHLANRCAAAAALALSLAGSAFAAPSYTLQHFTPDGIEAPARFDDISDAGVVVGDASSQTAGLATFANGVITLVPNSSKAAVPHINALGDVSADVPAANAVGIWWQDGTQTLVKVLGSTRGMNAKRQLIGQEAQKPQQAGIFEAGAYRRLASLDGHPGSFASAINDEGVVVGKTIGVSPRPLKWAADGTVHRLGSDAEVGIGQAVDINNWGHIVGCTDVLGCFLHKGSKFKKLPKASGHKVTSVTGISDDDVVLAYTYSHGFRGNVVYCSGASYLFTDLLGEEGSHWADIATFAINGSGQIIGHGKRDGVFRVFIATMATPCT